MNKENRRVRLDPVVDLRQLREEIVEIFNIVVLSLSGLLLLSIGALRLSNPIGNYSKNSGIKIENDVNLLNEVRGTSSLMFFGGATILSGIIAPQLTFASFVVATLIFFGFAFGRLLSVRLDGMPNKLIIQGLIFELVLGSLNIFGLFKSLA